MNSEYRASAFLLSEKFRFSCKPIPNAVQLRNDLELGSRFRTGSGIAHPILTEAKDLNCELDHMM